MEQISAKETTVTNRSKNYLLKVKAQTKEKILDFLVFNHPYTERKRRPFLPTFHLKCCVIRV